MRGRSSFYLKALSLGAFSLRALSLRALAAALAATTLAGCQFSDALSTAAEEEARGAPTGTQRITSGFVQSLDPQATIGAAEHPTVVRNNGGAYSDPKLEALLAVVTAELVAAGGKKPDGEPAHAYRITVLDSDAVNAFALPGGYLYVTRGLVALANDASEIAAVLAHEMAHVDASHGVERIQATRASDIATKVAASVVSDTTASAVARASTGRKLAAFSQRQELEADKNGIDRAAGAGFDPAAATRFLRSMRLWSAYQTGGGQSVGGQSGGGQGGDGRRAGDLSATHPSTPERVSLAKAHAARLKALGQGGATYRDRYLEGVDGLVFGPSGGVGVVRDRVYAHRTLAVRFEVPEAFRLRDKNGAALATGPDQMAVRFDTVPRRDMVRAKTSAAYILSGWVKGVDAASVRSARRAGMDLATARASAGAFDFAVAVFGDGKHFYRFITAAPKGSGRLAPVSRAVSASFRRTGAGEIAALKPLRIRVRTVGEGDTAALLGQRMATGGTALFRALNALDAGEEPVAGTKVKVIAGE